MWAMHSPFGGELERSDDAVVIETLPDASGERHH